MDIKDSKKESTLYRICRQFPKKIDRTLKYETPLWLDDIIVVTRGDKDKHREKLFKKLKQLQEPGYCASKKIEFFLNETIWLGHEITEHERKLNQEKTKVILQLKSPMSCKELISFLRAVQNIANFLPKLSEKTD